MENYKDYALKLFKDLVGKDTQSSETSKTYPSTESQLSFGKYLAKLCTDIGLTDVSCDEYGYITALLPDGDSGSPKIGLIAHMDTSPEFSGKNISPQIHENYDGGEIPLKNGITISPSDFPSLNNYKGDTIITSDGSTLLGADDKAGICAILTAMKYLIDNPSIPRKQIKIAFTPDEEIGKGTKYFKTKKFGCDYAFTIDGGEIGELNYETFNAARAEITIRGKNVHPGSAKSVMINSALISAELISCLPPDEIPSKTCGKEGFYHLNGINGNVEKTSLNYLIRAFDKNEFNSRKEKIKEIVSKINKKYGDIVSLNLYDEYYNMYEIIKDTPEPVKLAKEAMTKAGVKPKIISVRGGTDGSHLSFMGLPSPNIFAGGHNFHGPYEYLPLNSLLKSAEVIVNICSNNDYSAPIY